MMINNCKLRLRKGMQAGFFGFVFLIFASFLPMYAADSIDSSNSSIGFTAITNYAVGLIGRYADFNSSSKTNYINQKKDNLIIKKIGFSNIEAPAESHSLVFSEEDSDADVEPRVIGEALCYPNPFRQNSEKGCSIGYRLSKDMDIEFYLYNMLAQLVIKKTYRAGSSGGSKAPHYNVIQINKTQFDSHLLSAGVYFFMLVSDGKVLAKGKMGVKP